MSQIYQEFNDCLMPRLGFVRPVSKPHFALMYWPNGKPCALINFWLTELSATTTGRTVKQYAVWITPYIRYCYERKIALSNFSDSDMIELVRLVSIEKANGLRVKANDAVNLMIDSIIAFLKWLQTSGNPTECRNIVGLASLAPKVSITLGKGYMGHQRWIHAAHLETSTEQHTKVPMPRDVIVRIEDQVFLESDPKTFSGVSAHKLNSGSCGMIAVQRYLFERRSFSLWLFQRTGLRPEELSQIPLSANLLLKKSSVLLLPTKKRRTDSPALRRFKLSPEAILAVTAYIDARQEFLDSLKQRGMVGPWPDKMLLTERGGFMSAASLTRDFSRIIKRAGLSDVRACLSMFRHRFITLEVMVHMKEVLRTNKPTRSLLTDAVVKSIEKRIKDKTGHKLGKSIWNYFDSAFDLMGYWGAVDKTLGAMNRLEDAEYQANRLQYRIRSMSEGEEALARELGLVRREIAELRRQLALNS